MLLTLSSKVIKPVTNLKVEYNGQTALHIEKLQLPEVGLVAVLGSNGSGKSTLFKALLGLLPATGIYLLSKIAADKSTSYLPQNTSLPASIPLRVRDLLEQGGLQKDKSFITELGLQRLLDKQVSQLSGGQLKRSLFLRSIISQPDILVLDEPFNQVDKETREVITKILLDYSKNHLVILSTHDWDFAKEYADYSLILAGKVVAYDSTQKLAAEKQDIPQLAHAHNILCEEHHA